MRTQKYMQGLTLIEIVVAVGIIALLVTMMLSLVSRFDNQAKERGLDSTFTLLEDALQEYYEFTDDFPEQSETDFANAVVHSEYLYQQLSSIPDSRKILEMIEASLIKNDYGTTETSPEIYDPWGTSLEYRYLSGETFPVLISAGQDKIFDTADDIRNR
jgi:type II secretory pathway pseudopilin PulG